MATVTKPNRIANYRIEHIMNGYIVHVTHGKDVDVQKYAFFNKREMFEFLDDNL